MKTKWTSCIFIIFSVFLLAFAGCEQPGAEPAPEPTKLVIKNQSAYDLTNIMWDNEEIGTLARNASKTISITGDKSAYISFTRDDIKINCRTVDVFTSDKSEFVFLDSTLVNEVEDSTNRNTLSKISFLSSMILIYDGRNIAQNDRIDFGEVLINESKTINFILKNNGTGKLLLEGNRPVTIEDTNNVFTITQPSKSEVLSGESLEFSIACTATQVAMYTGKVSVASNDASGDISFFVEANASIPKPIIEVSYDGRNVAQNDHINLEELLTNDSKTINFLIKNSGNGKLILEGNLPVTIEDTNDVFDITQPSKSEVLPDESLEFSITFTSTQAAIYTGKVFIATNDVSDDFSFSVKATVLPTPIIAISHDGRNMAQGDSIDFGELPINKSKTISILIENKGNGKLLLKGYLPVTVEDTNNVFKVTQPSKSEVLSGESVEFSITFTSTQVAMYTGTVSIATNDASGDFSFSVKATAIPTPIIAVSYDGRNVAQNDYINLGEILTNESKTIDFLITNRGNGKLILEGNLPVTIEDTNDVFAITQPSKSEILPDESLEFSITFTSTQTAMYTGKISIATNDVSGDFSFSAKATAVIPTPIIAVSYDGRNVPQNDHINLGEILTNESKTINFLITNTGNGKLLLKGYLPVTVENTNNVFTIKQPSKSEILPDESVEFSITVTSTQVAMYTGTVSIATNDASGDFSFSVKATTVIPTPIIAVSYDGRNMVQCDSIDFGELLINKYKSKTISFLIENTGNAKLLLIGSFPITVEDTNNVFTITQSSKSEVLPGKSLEFSITFTADQIAGYTGIVSVASNDTSGNSSFSFSISGVVPFPDYEIGDRGPGGGLIFYIEGSTYYECSDNLGEADWYDAKTLATNHRGGDYDNWYLPNKFQLNYIYENLRLPRHITDDGIFWSSSDSSNNDAWYQYFDDGIQYYTDKTTTYYIFVRAIRAFTSSSL